MMRLTVSGIGLRGPGLDGWAASRPVLAGLEPYVPAPLAVPVPSLLPANERRRAPPSVKLALAVGAEALEAAGLQLAAATRAVFTSSGGDGETIHSILETLAGPERALSPTRFHNSVHNVAAGYWSIATGSTAATTSLSAHDGSFAAGLLEAGAQAMAEGEAVALIAYDMPYPGPLADVRQISEPFAAALLLTPDTGAPGRMVIELALNPDPGAATPASPAALERVRRTVPAARCLALLAALACGEPAEISLDYLDDLGLRVTVRPAAVA